MMAHIFIYSMFATETEIEFIYLFFGFATLLKDNNTSSIVLLS